MIPRTGICYANMITLCLLMEKLYPGSKILNVRDAFSEAIFGGILEKEKIEAIRRNSNRNAFYNGNIRIYGKKRCFHASKSVRAFSHALTEPELITNTYTQLIRNCRAVFCDAERRGVKITDDFFSFINEKNVYTQEFFDLIHLCIAKHRREAALALTIIVAIFQETSPGVISINDNFIKLLTDPSVEHQIDSDSLLEVGAELLKKAASQEGRLITYNDVRYKMNITSVSDLCIENSTDSACALADLYDTPQCENMLLVGCGGSGKTFALIDLGMQLIEKNNGILPFYLPLHTLNSKAPEDKSPIIGSLTSVINEHCGIAHETLTEFLRSHSELTLLLLLDDYNEITNRSVKLNFICEIMRIKREFKSIRFIITSRHDNSETFATGGELPFRIKQLLPPDDDSVRHFLHGDTKDDSLWCRLKACSDNVTDVLYNPMALTMYAYAKASGRCDHPANAFNLSLPFTQPETIGELLRNFTEQIKSTRSLKGTPEIQSVTESAAKILYCIAFKMYARNKNSLTQQGLKLFFSEALQKYNTFECADLSMDHYPKFLSAIRRMGYFICSRASEWQYRFYYQIFLSYFTARYLHYAIQSAITMFDSAPDTAVEILCDAFSISISDEVLRITGELALEHHFHPDKCNKTTEELSLTGQALRILQDRPDSPAVDHAAGSLRRIAEICRNNTPSLLSEAEFKSL